MRGLEKTFATLCAILFIVTAIPVLLLFNIERKAFSSATYKQAFEDQRLYERMPALLASALQVPISQNANTFPFLNELSPEDWQTTITTLLPPEELQAMADGALDSTFEFINNRSNTIVVSLLPMKVQLAGPSGVNMIKQFLQTQPACTMEQLTQMGLGLLGGSIALCNPPPEAIGLFEPFIQSQLQTISASIPNELVLTPEFGPQNDPRPRLHLVRSAIRFAPFFVFLLLAAIAVFAVRSFRDLLIWWGFPLLIVGTVSGVLGLVGAPIVGWLLQFVIQTQGMVFLPPIIAATLGEAARAVAGQMLIPLAIQGLVIAAIGTFIVVAGVILGKRTTYLVIE